MSKPKGNLIDMSDLGAAIKQGMDDFAKISTKKDDQALFILCIERRVLNYMFDDQAIAAHKALERLMKK